MIVRDPVGAMRGAEAVPLDQTLDLNAPSSLRSYDDSLSYTAAATEGGSTCTQKECAAKPRKNVRAVGGSSRVLGNIASNSFVCKPDGTHKRRHSQ
jgi:hypothetical protein